jgi:hypothetical protein
MISTMTHPVDVLAASCSETVRKPQKVFLNLVEGRPHRVLASVLRGSNAQWPLPPIPRSESIPCKYPTCGRRRWIPGANDGRLLLRVRPHTLLLCKLIESLLFQQFIHKLAERMCWPFLNSWRAIHICSCRWREMDGRSF